MAAYATTMFVWALQASVRSLGEYDEEYEEYED